MRNQEFENYSVSEKSAAASAAKGLPYLLIGSGIGAAIALLFAPKPGTELRGELADVTKRGLDATRERASELRAQGADALGTLREKADGLYQYASTRMGKSQEALDLAAFQTAMAEEGVRPLSSGDSDLSSRPTNRKSSNIM
jgi:gas vesicle protein